MGIVDDLAVTHSIVGAIAAGSGSTAHGGIVIHQAGPVYLAGTMPRNIRSEELVEPASAASRVERSPSARLTISLSFPVHGRSSNVARGLVSIVACFATLTAFAASVMLTTAMQLLPHTLPMPPADAEEVTVIELAPDAGHTSDVIPLQDQDPSPATPAVSQGDEADPPLVLSGMTGRQHDKSTQKQAKAESQDVVRQLARRGLCRSAPNAQPCTRTKN
jgi:hypothetical protein